MAGSQDRTEPAIHSDARAGCFPPEEHLLAAIDRVARQWSGPNASAPEGTHDGKPVPTAQELRAHAQAHDLALRYESRVLGSLSQDDFPCLALLASGRCVLLVARDDHGQFRVDRSRDVAIWVDGAQLQARYSGTIFFLKPKVRVATSQAATARIGAGGADVASQGGPTAEEALSDAKGLYRRVFDLCLHDERQALGKLGLAAGLSNLLVLALPFFTMAVYDRVIPHGAMETLWALSIGVFIALAVDLTLRIVRSRFADAVSLKIGLDLQASLYDRLMGAKLSEAPRSPGGLSRLAQEVDVITQAVPQFFISLAVDVPFFLILLLLLYSLGGPVVVAPLLGVCALLAVHIYAHVRARPSIEAAAEFNRQQSNQLVETLASLPTVKAAGASGELLRSWERTGDDAGYEGHRTRLWLNMTHSSQIIITQFVVVLTMIIGAYLVAGGAMTVGALAASTLLVGRSLSPVGQLVGHGVRLLHMVPSADVIARLMDSEQEVGGESRAARRRALSGAIEVSGLSFVHPGASRSTLEGLSFSIQAGERVAVIGRIGSGKSTLLHTLLRLHEPSVGSVLFDGADARQFAPDHIRRHFGYMAQDSILFDMSLREAITVGLGSVSDKAFERAVQLSGVASFASTLSQGYATPVGPRGSFLSGGERQAVALARVLAMEPAALLLDEPTASMDNTLELQLIDNLRRYIDGRTLILATHRAALLALVDRVIWLDRGRILADGPRDEVLAKINRPSGPAANDTTSLGERRSGSRRQSDGQRDPAQPAIAEQRSL